VLALLAVLLSYSYDFECLLESQGCQQQVLTVEWNPDCAQPGLVPAAIALLPTTSGWRALCPLTVGAAPRLWEVSQPALQPPSCRPLGQRAPPLV
jgi:hypothetical protein